MMNSWVVEIGSALIIWLISYVIFAKGLRLVRAFYYDPKIGYLDNKGTDVTRELSENISGNTLFYDGIYNNIFPDEFKRVRKKLFIEVRYNGKKYTKVYDENEKIDVPKNLFRGTSKLVDFLKNPWIIAFLGIIISGVISFAIGYYFYSLNNGGVPDKPEIVNNNLRLVRSLEVQESLNLLPDEIYGYVGYSNISRAVNDERIERLKFDGSQRNFFAWSYMFEIQKISNQEVYVIGYINDENFSKIGDIERNKNTEIMVFPSNYEQFNNQVKISLYDIISIQDRCIENSGEGLIFPSEICILEIKAEVILDN